MGRDKRPKTNAMRMLEKSGVEYRVNYYDCDKFIDGIQIADMLSQPYKKSFKTLVTTGKSGEHFVFVLPIDEELDLKKAASAVGEKNLSMVHVKDIFSLTGYIRGGCSPIGMKKRFVTVVHTSATDFDEIIVSGGAIGIQLFLSPEGLLEVTGATVSDIVLKQKD